MCSKLDSLRFNLDPIDQFNLVELEPLYRIKPGWLVAHLLDQSG